MMRALQLLGKDLFLLYHRPSKVPYPSHADLVHSILFRIDQRFRIRLDRSGLHLGRRHGSSTNDRFDHDGDAFRAVRLWCSSRTVLVSSDVQVCFLGGGQRWRGGQIAINSSVQLSQILVLAGSCCYIRGMVFPCAVDSMKIQLVKRFTHVLWLFEQRSRVKSSTRITCHGPI